MTPAIALLVAAALGLGISGMLLWSDRGEQPPLYALLPLVVLAAFAAIVAFGPRLPIAIAPLVACTVIALLARAREDVFHSECALKLLWVMSAAFALSWAGASLLVVATGTALPREQWAVLAVGLGGQMLWSMAIPLVLLVGLVLLAGAPFHFWAADLFQGARAWLAPLAIAALQVCGVAWVENRLEVVEAFESAAAIAGGLLGIGAATALAVGGLTLLWQRRPERRVGTLASLQGGLALAWLAAEHAHYRPTPPSPGLFEAWASHLVLALTGAAVLARLTPVPSERTAAPAVLFRRHPAAGFAGLYALASLAGVPGTPGAAVWLAVARELVVSGRTAVLLALGFAWLASFAFAMQQVRDSFGVPPRGTPPENAVPRVLRAAMWLAGGGLAALGAMQWLAAR